LVSKDFFSSYGIKCQILFEWHLIEKVTKFSYETCTCDAKKVLSKNIFHYRSKFSAFRTGSEFDRNRNKTFQRPQTDDFNIRFRGFEDNLEVLLNQCKKELAGVNLTNILLTHFLYKSVLPRFSLITVLLCNFLMR